MNKITLDDVDRLVKIASTMEGIGLPPSAATAFVAYRQHVSERLNYYRLLSLLMYEFAFDFAIELGVEYGVASEALAHYDATVIGIDINKHGNIGVTEELHDNYLFLQRDTTYTQTFYDTRDMLKEVGLHIPGYGLIFQDSSHHYHASHKEWNYYSSLLAPGSVWICDDITSAFHDPNIDPPGKGMVQYFQELPVEQKKLYPDVLHHGNTMGVILL